MKTIRTAATIMLGLAASLALAQDAPLAVAVNAAKGEIMASVGDHVFTSVVSKEAAVLTMKPAGAYVRFSIAESGVGQDWTKAAFVSGEVLKDAPDEKQVKAVYSLAFAKAEPDPKTTRGSAVAAGLPPLELNAQIELILTVKAGIPACFAQYKVVNAGKPFSCYCLPWGSGAETYAVPGPNGPEPKEFLGKYAAISKGTLPWVYSARTPNQNYGMIFPTMEKIYIGEYGVAGSKGGSIYLNTIPQKHDLGTGGSVTVEYILVQAKDATDVEAVYKKVSAK